MFGFGKNKGDKNNLSLISEKCKEYFEKVDHIENKSDVESEQEEVFAKRTIEVDEYFVEAARLFIEGDRAMPGLLQKRFSIGFNRACRLMDQLADEKIIGSALGAKPRNVLITKQQFETYLQKIEIKIKEVSNGVQTQSQIGFVDYNEYMSYVDLMDGYQFEHFCAELLKTNGFDNVSVTQGSGDRGIDIFGEKNGMRYAIQCKHYLSNVGNHAVQEAFSGKSIYSANIAVVMTNSYFTSQAEQDARKLCVELWNRSKLLNMLENSGVVTDDSQGRELTEDEVRDVFSKICEAYRSLGINIEVKQAIIEKECVKYGVKPESGIRIKKFYSCREDISFALKTKIDIGVDYEEGLIEIIIPKKYFLGIS